jgi:predicted DNA-binding transcriptional regulator AlpA|tara:strand:- start:352 stop:573 length:222 start_codon:yes stop_codon:yes gene_type:complete
MQPINKPLYVRPGSIKELTGIARSKALQLEIDDPKFPKRFKLSPKLTVWNVSELEHYIESLPRLERDTLLNDI